MADIFEILIWEMWNLNRNNIYNTNLLIVVENLDTTNVIRDSIYILTF